MIDAYVDTARDGKQIDSLTGAVDGAAHTMLPLPEGWLPHLEPPCGNEREFRNGQVVGVVAGIAEGIVLGNAAGAGSRAAAAYVYVETGAGMFTASYNIINGEASVSDALAFLPAASMLASGRRGVQTASNLADDIPASVTKHLDEIPANLSQQLEELAPRGGFDLSQSVGAARVSSWSSRLEGTRLKQVGNYWIKEVDPNASAFRQWWGRGSLNAQAKALDRLGDMAPSHLYRNGKLVIRDVGEFAGTRGDVFQTWLRGSWRLRTPMNDIRGRNMGGNGLIFDPAWHPIAQRAVEGGTIFVIYKGGELIYLMVEGEE
ncbi:MAG: hypothetical protein O3C40_35275 [Planctomycetota bacterium]|nr:hypothetical protein [Planctomycetota bacterium]